MHELIFQTSAPPSHSKSYLTDIYNAHDNITTHLTLIPTDFLKNNQLLCAVSFLKSPAGFLQFPSTLSS